MASGHSLPLQGAPWTVTACCRPAKTAERFSGFGIP
jgi:hypothetical protein